MAFEKMPGVVGKVWVPDRPCDGKEGRECCKKNPTESKHPCPDCFSCQQCSDDRCRLCRGETEE